MLWVVGLCVGLVAGVKCGEGRIVKKFDQGGAKQDERT